MVLVDHHDFMGWLMMFAYTFDDFLWGVKQLKFCKLLT